MLNSTNQQTTHHLSDNELLRYSRQILLPDWDLDAQLKLKQSRVIIVGAGGIGCATAELLARAGVGTIHVIDPDHVELSNLQRQIAFDERHLQQNKATVLAQRLKQINPHINVIASNSALDHNNAHDLFNAVDLVLDGCDNFETRYLVNYYCVQLQRPLCSAAAIGFDAQLCFLSSPQTACYHCLFASSSKDEQQNCMQSGVLATMPIMIATLQAHYTLLYLGLNLSPLLGHLLTVQGLSGQQKTLKINRDPSCKVCSQ